MSLMKNVQKFFSKVGTVEFVKMHYDRAGRSEGELYVLSPSSYRKVSR